MAMKYFIEKTFPITENIIWKRTSDIPQSERTVKTCASDPKNYAKNYPQSFSLASKLKDIIDDCVGN